MYKVDEQKDPYYTRFIIPVFDFYKLP